MRKLNQLRGLCALLPAGLLSAVLLLAVLFVGLMAALPAEAARRMTVAELEQQLAARQAAHVTDGTEVRELAEVELSDRVDEAARARLLALAAGSLSRQALGGLAELSLFEPGKVVAAPAPDVPTQKAIMGRTVNFVVRTMPRLPDFLAQRVTTHLDDTPEEVEKDAYPVRAGLHVTATSTGTVTYRNGQEEELGAGAAQTPGAAGVKKTTASAARAAVRAASSGMNSWGEFGPILSIVLLDAAKSKLGWSHWEMLGGRQAAVFQFTVARENSHYVVQFCCSGATGAIDKAAATNTGYGRLDNESDAGSNKARGRGLLHGVVGYHGEMYVDPESGAIERIMLRLDLKPDDPIEQGEMLVDYGPVSVGPAEYVLPMRSVTVSTAVPGFDSQAASQVKQVAVEQMNEVEFTGYHRFGSEATLVTDVAPDAVETQSPGGQVTAAGPLAVVPLATTSAASAETSAPPPTTSAQPAATATAVVTPSAVTPAVAMPAAESEVTVDPTKALPWSGNAAGENAGENASNNAGKGTYTLQVTSRVVSVSLLAFDRRNRPVTDLKPDQLRVLDNGQAQQLVSFQHAGGEATPAAGPATAADDGVYSNEAASTVAVGGAPDLLVLLLDESHIPFQDLTIARQQVERFLAAVRPDARLAIYAMGEHGFHVIQDVTADHALVRAKFARWMPSAAAIAQAQELDRRDRQQFDTVHSAADLNSVNGNYTEVPDTQQTLDPELRQMGDNPLRGALESMMALARHFGAVPGHKSLAWISGDSALSDWQDRAVSIERTDNYVEAALARTREALNEAHIALYAVDVSQNQSGQIDSGLQNQMIQLNQASADNAAAQGGGMSRASAAGRVTAAMQTDLHGIQGPVSSLAESTGGRAVRRGGDLAATLNSIEEEDAGRYELSFHPSSTADGKYHTLTISVAGRKDLKLRYRGGYLYTEETASNQTRFQRAVWTPEEMAGVGLTVEPVAGAATGTTKGGTAKGEATKGEAGVKVRIRFAGLGLRRQQAAGSNGQSNGQLEARWSDDLYVFVAERNDATQKAEVSGDTLRLRLKQATYDSGMAAGIPYERAVTIHSRLDSVRVVVVDGNTGQMGTVTIPAEAFLPRN